jgi:hypothetical protein
MSQITVTKILDGAKNSVVHVFLRGDGSGDLNGEVIIDPAVDFTPPLPPVPELRIEQLWYDFIGFTGYLFFDDLVTGTPVWSMSAGQANQPDFSCFGGLTDRSDQLDGSGQLKLTTMGLDASSIGTLILLVKKS